MIADRRSQIAIRSAIVCDHMETTSAILRSRSQTIAEDRTMFFLKAGFHMIADDRRPYCDLRSAIIWKPAFNSGFESLQNCGAGTQTQGEGGFVVCVLRV